MNKFFKYIQPTIVKTSDDEELPENLRNRFFINLNIFGIDYFEKNFLLEETIDGVSYLMLKEDSWEFELEDSVEGDVLDAPRIYIDITDSFVNSNGIELQSYIHQSVEQNGIFAVGVDNFLAGKDFYMNYTLYNYLANNNLIETPNFAARLPNYLDIFGNITKYWVDLSGEVYADYTNLEYYNERNKLLDFTYSEDELNNFYANFCKIILDNTTITDELKSTTNNQIYDIVLHYYASFQSDDASNAVNLILNTAYTSGTTTSGCGCSTSTSSTGTSTDTCSSLYAQGLYKYLIQMLGDVEFYEDWFNIQLTDSKTIPNDVLIEKLQVFFDEFFKLNNCLNFATTNLRNNCNCQVISYDDNDCNYKIMNNYLKILSYCSDETLEANTNKIKIYGQQFGELLPKLQF